MAAAVAAADTVALLQAFLAPSTPPVVPHGTWLAMCASLMRLDDPVVLVPVRGLCASYPPSLVVPLPPPPPPPRPQSTDPAHGSGVRTPLPRTWSSDHLASSAGTRHAAASGSPSNPSMEDSAYLRQLLVAAHEARVRTRFVAPVLLCRRKYICRSATLSVNVEVGVSGSRRGPVRACLCLTACVSMCMCVCVYPCGYISVQAFVLVCVCVYACV
jgi:hypothetical protein